VQTKHERQTAHYRTGKPEKGNRAQGSRKPDTPFSAGQSSYEHPDDVKRKGHDKHGQEHIPLGENYRNKERGAGDRRNKDKNVAEIRNDRGKMLKPVHR